MDETRTTTGSSEIVLMRIVATLLALADLAEQIRSQPAPVRYLVLWLLRSAESVAREFVVEFAPSTATAGNSVILRGDKGAGAALRLAVQFRTLAAIVQNAGFREQFVRLERYDTGAAMPVPAGMFGWFLRLDPRAAVPNREACGTLAFGVPDTS